MSPRNLVVTTNFRRLKCDMKQIASCGPTVEVWPVNLPVIRHFLFDACELVLMMPNILCTTVQNLLALVTRLLGLVHLCHTKYCVRSEGSSQAGKPADLK